LPLVQGTCCGQASKGARANLTTLTYKRP
jgi:hypothetical protein